MKIALYSNGNDLPEEIDDNSVPTTLLACNKFLTRYFFLKDMRKVWCDHI